MIYTAMMLMSLLIGKNFTKDFYIYVHRRYLSMFIGHIYFYNIYNCLVLVLE